MLRIALAVALGFGAVTLAGLGSVVAQDKKDEKKTLEGTLTCTKCALGETEGLRPRPHREGRRQEGELLPGRQGRQGAVPQALLHRRQEGVKVTGKVGEKDGKKIIEEPKVEIQEVIRDPT